jgi:hypothetical protein
VNFGSVSGQLGTEHMRRHVIKTEMKIIMSLSLHVHCIYDLLIKGLIVIKTKVGQTAPLPEKEDKANSR